MKLPMLMGLLALGLTLVLAASFFIEEQPAVEVVNDDGSTSIKYLGHGIDHPTHPKTEDGVAIMLAGGPGEERAEPILGLAFVFGLLEIAFFMSCLAFGSRRNGKVGPIVKYIVAGGIVYAGAFIGLITAYRNYMSSDTLTTFGNLPTPTAWMMYALWPAPVFFLLVFIFGFQRFIWNDEDEAAFRAIVAEKQAEEGSA